MAEELDELHEMMDSASQEAQSPVSSSGLNFDSIEDDELRSQVMQLEDLASMDDSIRESEDYKDIMAKVQEGANSGNAKKNVVKNEEVKEEEEDDEFEDEEDSELEDENPFLSNKKTPKAKEIAYEGELPDDYSEFLKKQFGVEDPNTFLNSVTTWRQQAQEGSELKKQWEAVSNDLNALPYEIKAQIDAWSKGEDFIDVVKNMTRLDFDVDHSKQGIDTLVQHYLPEQYDELIEAFNSGDKTEEELDKELGLLARTTKKLFDRDKKVLRDERDSMAERAAEEQRAFKKSALVSVETLSKAYPDFSKSELNRVRQTLVEGKLDDLFFNSDGTYKDEAAELIAYALNGKKILKSVESRGRKKGREEEALEIVDKSPKKLGRTVAQTGKATSDTQGVEHLVSIVTKNDPYS